MQHDTVLNKRKTARVRRVRAKIFGDAKRPRLAIFRSNRGMYAQLIDDEKQRTVVSASSAEARKTVKGKKSELAAAVGALIAKKAVVAGIDSVVFDRRSYRYHGRVKALADAARKEGLKF